MTSFVKYPKTYHFPWSLGVKNDDRVQHDLSFLEGKDVVVTEKMDGENTTMTSERIYARSVDSAYHESQDWCRGLWGQIRHLIPTNVRICGENLTALHSIPYNNLESYFFCFSIWDGEKCLDWDTTLEFCTMFGLKHVPVLYEGIYDEEYLKTLSKQLDFIKQEGFVTRLREEFFLDDFSKSVVKFVRANHVQTDKHWKTQKIIYNKLRPNEI